MELSKRKSVNNLLLVRFKGQNKFNAISLFTRGEIVAIPTI